MTQKEEWILKYFVFDASEPFKKTFKTKEDLREFLAGQEGRVEAGKFAICAVSCVHTTKFDVRDFYKRK